MVEFSTEPSAGPVLTSEGRGPAVLLMPGLMSVPSVWAPVARVLSERFRVITCELNSYLPPGNRSVPDQVQCWRDVMDYLEEPSAHLIGYGSGCQVATSLALESPYRALSLAVVDPVIRRTSTGQAVQDSWHLNMLTQWLETGHGPMVRKPEHRRVLEQVLAQQTLAQLPFPSATADLSWPREHQDAAGLADLDFPVLAVTGSGEPAESTGLVQAVYGRAPHSTFQQVPGVRSSTLREQPALLAHILDRFLCEAVNPVTA